MTQDTRLIRLSASFIDDSCVATELQGKEALSSPFQFEISFLSDTLDLGSADIIGQKISIAIHDEERSAPIYRHGRVNQLVLQDVSENGVRLYRISVVPGLWFLSQANSNRIFENQTGLEIVEEILSQYSSFCTLQSKIKGKYLQREYCVQFNETDLDFVQRLLAEDGINYYFTFSDSDHTLVLTDQSGGFVDCSQNKVIKQGLARTEGVEGAVIRQWSRTLNYHPKSIQQQDYNQDTPKNPYTQQVTTTTEFCQAPPVNTVQQYGGYNFKSGDNSCHDFDVEYNQLLTKYRMEAMEARHSIASGNGNCASFHPGGRFEMVHHVASESGKYLLWEVRHQARNQANSPSSYDNQFTCIPAATPPRPTRAHMKQRMPGPQMAKVMSLSASGSAAEADPQRMIKVQFPWDSAHNSCKLRVLQAYAGSGWGASFVPREGQEVLVDFISGDPDRPIVVGAIYNKDNQGPKYTSTQSGWLTQSGNANEFRFDDKGGAEEVYMKAGKDYNYVVANNETGQVQNAQSLSVASTRSVDVGSDETKTVGANQSITVGSDQSVAVGANQTLTVGANQSITIGSNKTEMVAINVAETIGAAKELTIGGLYQVTVGAAMNETVGAAKAEEVGLNRTLVVGKDMSESVGKNRSLSVGDTSSHSAKKIQITAEDELTIKVGKASLTMKKDGTITISGKEIDIKGSGAVNVKASKDVVIKGKKVLTN